MRTCACTPFDVYKHKCVDNIAQPNTNWIEWLHGMAWRTSERNRHTIFLIAYQAKWLALLLLSDFNHFDWKFGIEWKKKKKNNNNNSSSGTTPKTTTIIEYDENTRILFIFFGKCVSFIWFACTHFPSRSRMACLSLENIRLLLTNPMFLRLVLVRFALFVPSKLRALCVYIAAAACRETFTDVCCLLFVYDQNTKANRNLQRTLSLSLFIPRLCFQSNHLFFACARSCSSQCTVFVT